MTYAVKVNSQGQLSLNNDICISVETIMINGCLRKHVTLQMFKPAIGVALSWVTCDCERDLFINRKSSFSFRNSSFENELLRK